ncbi:hypothetical protein EPUL_000347 [Erysiphe pulchra]|uniref:Uncharacterized protein n=1 Tax=Erysiphe pulchra TaxID=225359 RepID=A0A2S4Q1L9_9PEZI|nr:hypothetical protein EPUL_000347 [Erysiphe pulchra]
MDMMMNARLKAPPVKPTGKFFPKITEVIPYAYKCGLKLYNEDEIKGAMKKSCAIWEATKNRRVCKSGICETKVTSQRDQMFKKLPSMGYEGAVILFPILRNSKIYQFENFKEAGHDRIVSTKDCRLVGIVTSVRYPRTYKIESCLRNEKSTHRLKHPHKLNALDLKANQNEILNKKLEFLKLQKLKGKEILGQQRNSDEASTSGTKPYFLILR